jgi:hypothetical protein
MNNENAIVLQNNAVIMPSVPDEQTINSVWQLAKIASASGMSKARKPEDAFFIAMYGLELGIPPMTALRTIYSISGGVPTCSGEALLSLMRKSPKVRVEVPNVGEITDSATITIKRLDTGEQQSFTYTKEMAQKAGLTNKDNWKKHLHMMLFWRVVSMGAKAMCSDIVGGLYTIEEIAPDSQVNEQGELVGEVIIESPPQPKVITHDFKQRPQEPAPIPEGTKCSVKIIHRKTFAKEGKPRFNKFTANTGEWVSMWSRDIFKNKGYCTGNDWTVDGDESDMDFTAIIEMQPNGFWAFIPDSIPDFNHEWEGLGQQPTEQPALLDNATEGDLNSDHYANDMG